MKRLKLNVWTGILDIINCILFSVSWFVIFGTAFSDASNGGNSTGSAAVFFYGMAWAGVVLNVIALAQSRRYGISLVGPVLGLIGSLLFGITAAMALPALVVLIIGTVFTFLQHPKKDYQTQQHPSEH